MEVEPMSFYNPDNNAGKEFFLLPIFMTQSILKWGLPLISVAGKRKFFWVFFFSSWIVITSTRGVLENCTIYVITFHAGNFMPFSFTYTLGECLASNCYGLHLNQTPKMLYGSLKYLTNV